MVGRVDRARPGVTQAWAGTPGRGLIGAEVTPLDLLACSKISSVLYLIPYMPAPTNAPNVPSPSRPQRNRIMTATLRDPNNAELKEMPSSLIVAQPTPASSSNTSKSHPSASRVTNTRGTTSNTSQTGSKRNRSLSIEEVSQITEPVTKKGKGAPSARAKRKPEDVPRECLHYWVLAN